MADELLRNIFPKKLKYYMDLSGKNQAELCKYMNVSSATVSDWCNGNKMPRADKIQAIAKWLGVNIGNLMDDQDTAIEYYLNPETREIAQEIYENKDLSLLFDAARDATPEDLKTVHTMLMALKAKEEHRD